MKKPLATVLLVLTGVIVAGANTPTFDRYRVIIDRKPFGDPPPAPVAAGPAVPPQESFARTIRLTAILETEDGDIRVGLINLRNNESFFLSVGETKDGIELVSANYDDEEAVLSRGAEMAVIKFQTGEAQSITPQEHAQRMQARAPQMGYEERRRARREQAQARPPPPEPIYTGEALEKHLQEYQMEVIRQGLPPLPIPLTEEMDRKLVEEGVLPPLE